MYKKIFSKINLPHSRVFSKIIDGNLEKCSLISQILDLFSRDHQLKLKF